MGKKWKPAPETTYDWAHRWAKQICGPLGVAAFIKHFKPGHRYVIAAQYKEGPKAPWKLAIIGTGKNWAESVADAKKNVGEAIEERIKADPQSVVQPVSSEPVSSAVSVPGALSGTP